MIQIDRWKPGPAYLSRFLSVKRWLPKIGNGLQILEVGCGESNFACWAAKQGFSVTAIDLSEKSCLVQRERAKKLGLSIDVLCTDEVPKFHSFDFLCALEIIEHVADDIRILRDFRKALVKNGTLILTVPAKMKKWSKFDEQAGHFRRYEKQELIDKLFETGFGQFKIVSYGFPVMSVTHWFEKTIRKNEKISESEIVRSQKSGGSEFGFRKRKWLIRLAGLFFFPLISAQYFFYKTDLGEGYSVRGKAI
jgi:2-polyprenyl-3-methyl-5-hydroxy-6-metoxy-1,4-benzoquinol methylase